MKIARCFVMSFLLLIYAGCMSATAVSYVPSVSMDKTTARKKLAQRIAGVFEVYANKLQVDGSRSTNVLIRFKLSGAKQLGTNSVAFLFEPSPRSDGSLMGGEFKSGLVAISGVRGTPYIKQLSGGGSGYARVFIPSDKCFAYHLDASSSVNLSDENVTLHSIDKIHSDGTVVTNRFPHIRHTGDACVFDFYKYTGSGFMGQRPSTADLTSAQEFIDSVCVAFNLSC